MAAATDSVRVSVAMCTYNGAEYIGEQLASILSQTRMPDQLVVADDGSSDGTLELVRAEVQRARADRPDQHFDYLELPGSVPLGVVRNFERALLATDGDIVVLSDQDDIWSPERIALSVAALHNPNVYLVHGDAELIDDRGLPLGVDLFAALEIRAYELEAIDRGTAFAALLRRNLVTGATAAVRRDLVTRALPVPDGWIHDEWLGIVAATLGSTCVLRARVIQYRQHGRNQIGARRLGMGDRFRKLQEPRATRNGVLLVRARALLARLSELSDVDPAKVELAAGKLAHELARSALPAARWKRAFPIVREWLTGGYNRFGLGLQDVLRDLVQPGR